MESPARCIHGFFKVYRGGKVEYPFVQARLYIDEELRGTIDFLVDTGAGASLLAFKDLLALGLPPMLRGRPKRNVVGVGGSVPTVLLKKPVRLELMDKPARGEAGPPITIELDGIDCEDPDAIRRQMRSRSGRIQDMVMTKPSLLGWDVLSRLEVHISYVGEKKVLLCRPTATKL